MTHAEKVTNLAALIFTKVMDPDNHTYVIEWCGKDMEDWHQVSVDAINMAIPRVPFKVDAFVAGKYLLLLRQNYAWN